MCRIFIFIILAGSTAYGNEEGRCKILLRFNWIEFRQIGRIRSTEIAKKAWLFAMQSQEENLRNLAPCLLAEPCILWPCEILKCMRPLTLFSPKVLQCTALTKLSRNNFYQLSEEGQLLMPIKFDFCSQIITIVEPMMKITRTSLVS